MTTQIYTATIETFSGPATVSYTDAAIDQTEHARLLRDLYRQGAHVTPSQIAAAAWSELAARRELSTQSQEDAQ